MKQEQVIELALSNGFKMKEQPDGTMALNPYVFDFVRAVEQETLEMAARHLERIDDEEYGQDWRPGYPSLAIRNLAKDTK